MSKLNCQVFGSVLLAVCICLLGTAIRSDVILRGETDGDRALDYATKYRGIVTNFEPLSNGFTLGGTFTLQGLPYSIRLRGIILTTSFRPADVEGLYVACRGSVSEYTAETPERTRHLNCTAKKDGVTYDVGERLVEQGKAVNVCNSLHIVGARCEALFMPNTLSEQSGINNDL